MPFPMDGGPLEPGLYTDNCIRDIQPPKMLTNEPTNQQTNMTDRNTSWRRYNKSGTIFMVNEVC